MVMWDHVYNTTESKHYYDPPGKGLRFWLCIVEGIRQVEFKNLSSKDRRKNAIALQKMVIEYCKKIMINNTHSTRQSRERERNVREDNRR